MYPVTKPYLEVLFSDFSIKILPTLRFKSPIVAILQPNCLL